MSLCGSLTKEVGGFVILSFEEILYAACRLRSEILRKNFDFQSVPASYGETIKMIHQVVSNDSHFNRKIQPKRIAFFTNIQN